MCIRDSYRPVLDLIEHFPIIDSLEVLDICKKSLKFSLRKPSRHSVHIDKGYHGEMQTTQGSVLEYEEGVNLGENNISTKNLKMISDGIELSGNVKILDLCISLH
eukprot:TRINITY_DN1316_c0_g1_i5.p3 TRINITY_DN1316_c0_g1~~TRINITY_DN1316_c0_g1_i5.p3  ORF type:complete len:105 (+),score=8.09 TRINITY_DN1316_c0_g1_i5:73-387(+)